MNKTIYGIPLIKVCGIRNAGEALSTIEAGANTIGLLVGLTHKSEDEVSVEIAAAIVRRLPCEVRTVMVTHLLDPEAIAKAAASTGVSTVQIHDDLPVEGMISLRQRLPGMELVKAVHVTGPDALGKAGLYAPYVDMLLLDSRTEDRLGGTGRTHDWRISRQIVNAVDIPVILAGGLTPENVQQAICEVSPAGIDANSGLEHPDGSKDAEKVRAFASAGRHCRYEKRPRTGTANAGSA